MREALLLIGTFMVGTLTLQMFIPAKVGFGLVWLYSAVWAFGVTLIVAGATL